jgi:predicted ATPase
MRARKVEVPERARLAMIDAVQIEHFRSIPSQTVRMTNPIFLVGANGSGKSNFADVFSFLADAMERPLQTVFDHRGGVSVVQHRSPDRRSRKVGLGIDLSNLHGDELEARTAHYAFEAREVGGREIEVVREQCVINLSNARTYWFDREGESIRSNVAWVREFKGKWFGASLAMPVIGSVSPFSLVHAALKGMKVYSIDPEAVSGMQETDSGLTLHTNGNNAASVLTEIKSRAPDDYRRIGEVLASVSSGIDEVRPSGHGKQMGFEFVQRWGGGKYELTFDAFNMSHGTLRALGILLAVYQRVRPFLLVMEEPEASLHPGAVNTILNVLRNATSEMQVIITTHSPEVLDSEGITDESIRFVTWAEGKTTVSDLTESSRSAIRKHLMGIGELLRSNALEPAELFENVRRSELFVEVE